jgi:glutathione S-transferase
MLRLVTIPISHYCEKARWALDRAGLRYREEPHVQGLHRLYARRAGGGATVPVLVTPEGAVGESAAIIEWVDRRLDPERRLTGEGPAAAEIAAVCRRLDERMGPCGRRLIYVRMFEQRELMLRFNNQGVPRWEDRLMRAGLPFAQRLIAHALEITPGVEVGDEDVVWEEFDRVGAMLEDGRPFLLGSRFTAADLTFAALAAPVLLPPTYGVTLPPLELLDEPTAALVRRGRAHPAGRFALRMVAEQRLPAPAGAAAGERPATPARPTA